MEKLIEKIEDLNNNESLLTIVTNYKLSESVLRELVEREEIVFDNVWAAILKYQNVSSEFINDYDYEFDWNDLAYDEILVTDEMLSEHFSELDWYTRQWISINRELSDNFMCEHFRQLDTDECCRHQVIPEDVLRRDAEVLDWSVLNEQNYLSDEFRIDYAEYLSGEKQFDYIPETNF